MVSHRRGRSSPVAGAGQRVEHVGTDLYPDQRFGEQVVEPERVVGGAAVGGDHEVARAVAAVDERGTAGESREATGRGDQQRGRAVEEMDAVSASTGLSPDLGRQATRLR